MKTYYYEMTAKHRYGTTRQQGYVVIESNKGRPAGIPFMLGGGWTAPTANEELIEHYQYYKGE